MDKNRDAPNGLSGSPCVNIQERWLPSPVPFGELVSQPRCLLIDYVIRIYTVFTVLYCEISFLMLMNFILIKGVCVCLSLSVCVYVCVCSDTQGQKCQISGTGVLGSCDLPVCGFWELT